MLVFPQDDMMSVTTEREEAETTQTQVVQELEVRWLGIPLELQHIPVCLSTQPRSSGAVNAALASGRRGMGRKGFGSSQCMMRG